MKASNQIDKGGRPTKYRAYYADQAYKVCLLGATDKQLASFFGVSESTINLWKLRHQEFLESVTRGKNIADAEVAAALFKRAVGYDHDAVKIFRYGEAATIITLRKHLPPDTRACLFWLKSRQPDKWRDG